MSPTLVALVLVSGAAYRFTIPVSERVHEYVARPDHATRRGYQNEVVSERLRFTLQETQLGRRSPIERPSGWS